MIDVAKILCSVCLVLAGGWQQTNTYANLRIQYPDGWRVDPKVSAFGIVNFQDTERKKDEIVPKGKALIVVVQTDFNSLEDLNKQFTSANGYKIVSAQIEAGKDLIEGERIARDVPDLDIHELDYVFRTSGHVYETSLIYHGDRKKYGTGYIQTLREITKSIKFPP